MNIIFNLNFVYTCHYKVLPHGQSLNWYILYVDILTKIDIFLKIFIEIFLNKF